MTDADLVLGRLLSATTLVSPSAPARTAAPGATRVVDRTLTCDAGKPTAYASIAGTKTARLFTSTDCQEDRWRRMDP